MYVYILSEIKIILYNYIYIKHNRRYVRAPPNAAFEIALVRLSETSDYLLGQVNNPLAVIRRTSENFQPYFMFHYIVQS